MSPNAYLLSSIAIGTAQAIDAAILVKFKNDGRLGSITTIFSFAEYAWAAVSFFAWQAAEGSFPRWLPVSFIAYVAAFFAAGVVVAIQNRGRNMSIPNDLAIAGGLFGLYFAVAAALHLTGAYL